MGQIKSALEIALEKTASIQGDPRAGKAREDQNTGKRLASAFLESGDMKTFEESMGKLDKQAAAEAIKGAVIFLNSLLQLPDEESKLEKTKRIGEALNTFLPDTGMPELFTQADMIFRQYIQSHRELATMLERQYAPKLRAKEQELSRKYGQEVRLRPEQDPEFASLLSRNENALREQYEGAIGELRARIAESAGLELN